MAEREGYGLALLGTPVAERRTADGQRTELVWRLRRALQVVAFLALEPHRRAERGQLIEAVWPDATAEAVRNNFHPTVSDARRTLGCREAIRVRHGFYALAPELEWDLDVERFRAASVEGRRLAADAPESALEVWQGAWKLYRGPFLSSFEAPWIVKHREMLREEYRDLLSALGSLAAELGKLTMALDAHRQVLLDEPYAEHVHRAVMELYGRQGRRDLVRRQFVRLQEILKELDVEPLEETQECYHRLMR